MGSYSDSPEIFVVLEIEGLQEMNLVPQHTRKLPSLLLYLNLGNVLLYLVAARSFCLVLMSGQHIKMSLGRALEACLGKPNL